VNQDAKRRAPLREVKRGRIAFIILDGKMIIAKDANKRC
jgi:hypothetical protein